MSEQPCAFHPDRLTGVRCARCDRPICPEDMIDAPVGVQCPVCAGRMREGAIGRVGYRARTRVERTRLGRRMTGRTLTQAIIGLNVVVAVVMLATRSGTTGAGLRRFGALVTPLPGSEWWRLFTSMFVHIGVFHLLFNMLALSIFGPAIEQRHGRLRFLGIYLGGGLLGAAASLAITKPSVAAGASGAVFAILGAWAAFFVRHRRLRGAREQLRSLGVLVAINLAFGFTVGGIDNMAHLGGLVGGFVLATAIESGGRTGARRYAGLAGAAVVGVAVLALVLPNLA